MGGPFDAKGGGCIYLSMLGNLFRRRAAGPGSLCVGILLVWGAGFAARAQDQGPIAAPPKFEVNRIPAVPHPGPPPIPVEVIIQKFAVNEDLAKRVYDTYNFTQTIRVEELSDDGGKFTATGQVY